MHQSLAAYSLGIRTYIPAKCSAKRCGLGTAVPCSVIPFPLAKLQCYRLGNSKLKKMRCCCCWLKGLSSRSQLINVRNATKRDGRSTIVRRVPTCVDASYVRMYVAQMHAVARQLIQTNCMHEAQLPSTTRCSSSVFVSFL